MFTKRNIIIFVGLAFICCIGVVVISPFLPEPEATPIPKAVSTSAVLPGNAPAPTYTLVPTDTPVPLAPPFEEIRVQHDAMTEAQWKNYRTQIEGTMVIGWHGWIDEVTGNPGSYKVMIDMDSPDDVLSYPEIRFSVPDDIALTLNVDQPVTFRGRIRTAIDMLGALDITLEPGELQ